MNIIDKPNNINYLTLLSLRGALKLEMLGMRKRGQSAYSIVKQRFGFKGNKRKVYDQLQNYIAGYKKQLQLEFDNELREATHPTEESSQ